MAGKSRKDQQCSGLRELLQDVNRQPWEYIVLPLRKVTQPSSPDAEQLSKYYADLLWTSTKMDPCSSDFWRQRRFLCKKLGTKGASFELLVTKNHLYMDRKNENVWFHRKWVLDTFGGWENELAFCTERLQRDTYDEQAWVQRFFAVLSCEIGIAEFDYALEAIEKDPENEFPWRHLWHLYEQIRGGEMVEDSKSKSELRKQVGKKLDSLFVRVIDTRNDFDWDFPFTKRELDSNVIRMNITMRGKKYLCAMEALLHLAILGYYPSKPVRDALADIYPITVKKSRPVEQIRYILDLANGWRAPFWTRRVHKYDL
ncbi:Protein farnesyltransferase/geranylgeranyltransferase type-1 subunit alpha [Striga hermonthica]|uniref:Protein farnesyltransferase/geranylgeranyltransferase type-1 subunit alpha n=1 Tax=Striga hermonthica TaxID=68872 RepID=A0A9N7RPX7_STRHE|nr:Protein farnesyltransferase/geranylgeranyltransferase type-1 subunit alpha [Striga hermonthica]